MTDILCDICKVILTDKTGANELNDAVVCIDCYADWASSQIDKIQEQMFLDGDGNE